MRDLRIGVLGCGDLGRELAAAVSAHPNAELVALADVDEPTLARAGESLAIGTDARFTGHEPLFDVPGLDAVVVVTPHTLHYDHVSAALDRGLDVLCEKPLVTDLEHALELERRVAASDSRLMVGYQRHLEPAFRYVHDRFAAGDARPTYVTAEIAEDWIQKYDETWRVDPALSGGGYLFDTGSHLLDALLWATDIEPGSVDATMDFVDEAERIDVRGHATIRGDAGEMVNLSFPGDVPRLGEFAQIWDERGSTRVDGHHWGEYEVVRIDADGRERAPDLGQYPRLGKVEAFVESVRSGTEPPATARDAVRVTAVKEAAYESARTGVAVPVDDRIHR